MNRLIITIILFFPVFIFKTACQTDTEITNLRLEFAGDQLIIKYNIINYQSSDRFNIWLEITDSAGVKIEHKSLTGDIGKGVKGGNNKEIRWDVLKDSVFIDETIFVDVKALKYEPEDINAGIKKSSARKKAGTAGLYLSSAVFPGWGNSKISDGTPFWLMGIAGYGCVASSVVYNRKAYSNYDEYINSPYIDIEDNNILYDKYSRQRQLSKIFAYSGIAVWATDMILLTIRASKRRTRSEHTKSRLSFGTYYDPFFNEPILRFCYRF